MTTILNAFGPVYEQSLVIREEITEALILEAKETLPKITDEKEKQLAMFHISEKGIDLFEKKIKVLYPADSDEFKIVEMLVGSIGRYFYSIKQFGERVNEALNFSSHQQRSYNLANKRPPPVPTEGVLKTPAKQKSEKEKI
jgi:hypothetical protein